MADTDNIDLLAGKIAELTDKLSGPGVTAAIEATRIEAYSALAGGGVALVIAIAGAVIAVRLWKAERDEYDVKRVGGVLLAVAAGVASLIALWSVADPWVWTTLSHPELRLAHNLMTR